MKNLFLLFTLFTIAGQLFAQNETDNNTETVQRVVVEYKAPPRFEMNEKDQLEYDHYIAKAERNESAAWGFLIGSPILTTASIFVAGSSGGTALLVAGVVGLGVSGVCWISSSSNYNKASAVRRRAKREARKQEEQEMNKEVSPVN